MRHAPFSATARRDYRSRAVTVRQPRWIVQMTYALWRKIPAPMRFFCMCYFFGVAQSYSKIGRVVAHNRLLLAARYIDGSGIEIGGPGRPLKVGANAHVQYVDRHSGDDLKRQYAEIKVTKKTLHPDIVANGETLDPISDSSQSFVIANHVIEHFENPILFFKNAYRVLKDQGILFLAIPDKEKTFDYRRPVTSFEHISHDFIHGPAGSRQAHFLEYVTLTSEDDGEKESRHYDMAAEKLMQEDYSIHFHVWDIEGMLDMISRIKSDFEIKFRIKCLLSSGDECIFILEKQT